jgi:TMEM175 potassium channel family protein
VSKERLTAFSDGVIAIIITIMVLEMRAPHEAEIEALRPILPKFLSYVLSFAFLGIYWNNHHHLFQVVERVGGGVLWANLHLLFWLSLTPFVTAWMGENHFAAAPVALYGAVLLCSGVAYFVLVRTLLGHHPKGSLLATAIGSDFKGKISVVIYAVAIGAAWARPLIACGLYVAVAILWLVPDRRVERALADRRG